MSSLDCIENEKSLKNNLITPELNIHGNFFTPLKEIENNVFKSFFSGSSDSKFGNPPKTEFSKEISDKNIFDDFNNSKINEVFNFKPIYPSTIKFNSNSKKSSFHMSNFNWSDIYFVNKSKNIIHKQIFKIIKIPKIKSLDNTEGKEKRYKSAKKYLCDWEKIKVPKEKHFHLDRKRHRIVFQRKHLKIIYSIIDLDYPFNFKKCFELIKKHVGNKTLQNYKEGKSFHIIKINNEEKIVTLKDKKLILKRNKEAKKNHLFFKI